jgi:probable rRNA maturation factor
MSAAIGVSSNGVRRSLGRERSADIVRAVLRAERVRDAMISVSFVSNRAIRTLNKRHLGRDRPTDVIAFGFRAGGKRSPIVGDVYIAPDVARTSARELGISVREELTRLVVHGTLHVLGHDHPDSSHRDQSPMWRRQERLVARLMRRRKRAR